MNVHKKNISKEKDIIKKPKGNSKIKKYNNLNEKFTTRAYQQVGHQNRKTQESEDGKIEIIQT